MKRSWRDKLEPDGVELLDDYRKLDDISTLDEFNEWVEAVAMPREQEGLANLFPNRVLVTMLLLELGKMLPETWQKLNEVEIDFLKHSELGAFRATVRRLIELLQRMEFGNEPLDGEKRRILAARFFGLCEQICRGQLVPPKGSQNLERADLVNFIREHERERLTWAELLEALQDAGANVPEDPEALRLWVWRAEGAGLVRPRRKAKKKGAERGGKVEP
jgi:hypothetical protein